MSANTIMMYFRLDSTELSSEGFVDKLKALGGLALGEMRSEPQVIKVGQGSELIIFTAPDLSHATFKTYQDGLVTLDLEHFVESNTSSPYDQEYIRSLQKKMRKYLGQVCKESNVLYVPIRRGQHVWPYTASDGGTLIENDYDQLVFETNSRFQNICIFHSKQCGNVLVLDGDVMLGESDLIYTTTLCRIGHVDYCDKEILILGGGDGGILYELLKESPKEIIMAEIDEEVIKTCRTHLRSVCGSSMDKYEDSNYKIIIDDCVKVLHDSIQQGHQFDYVINDLPEFPVVQSVKGYGYDFETTNLLTELALKVLKPGGKLLSRGDSSSATHVLQRFETDLRKLGCDFQREDVFVPSFQEMYSLYEIWEVPNINNNT